MEQTLEIFLAELREEENQAYVNSIEEYLDAESIRTISDLREAFIQITGEPLSDLNVREMIDEIMFKEEYAKFH